MSVPSARLSDALRFVADLIGMKDAGLDARHDMRMLRNNHEQAHHDFGLNR